MRFKKFFTLLLTILFLENFMAIKNSYNLPQSENKMQREHRITIFVHGTILPFPSFSAFKSTFKDVKLKDLKNNPEKYYLRYLESLRFDGLYKSQPIGELGLSQIDLSEEIPDDNPSKSTQKIAQFFDKNSKDFLPQDKLTTQSFYTFGWDGNLNSKDRLLWGEVFYENLIKEIDNIKKTLAPDKLFIEIISHSHGGNVSLNLALAEEKFKKNLKIDTLVLLGTPIQAETKDLIYSPIFKNILNIYSKSDPIQVIDIISTKDHWSGRKFKNKNKQLPNNLIQVKISTSKLSPLHNELWLWADKGNYLYRKKLDIYPYPVVVFVPVINYICNNLANDKKDLSVKIEKKNLENNLIKYSFLIDNSTYTHIIKT